MWQPIYRKVTFGNHSRLHQTVAPTPIANVIQVAELAGLAYQGMRIDVKSVSHKSSVPNTQQSSKTQLGSKGRDIVADATQWQHAGHPLSGAFPSTAVWSSAGMIQAKLEIGSPHDAMEQEADAVADRVVRGPASGLAFAGVGQQSPDSIQRKCAGCEDEMVQRKVQSPSAPPVASSQLSSQIQSTRGGGQRLDGPTRQAMEQGIGHDFGGVRIHTGDYATQMSREISAKAFTVGNDIYFNAGQYQPGTEQGKHLLAHELTHTVQQNHGIAPKQIQRDPETDQLPGSQYLDFFTKAYYDLDYRRVDGGGDSTWVILEYSDGTIIDFNLYDIVEQKDPAYSSMEALRDAHLGPGDRIIPASLNSATLPNLWRVRAEAELRMNEAFLQLLDAAMPAVLFVIAAGSSTLTLSKPIPRSSVAPIISQRLRAGYRTAGTGAAATVVFKASTVADDLFAQVAGVTSNARKMLDAGKILSSMQGLTAAQKLEAMLAFFNKIGYATKGAPTQTVQYFQIIAEKGGYMFHFMKDTGVIMYGKYDTTTMQWVWVTL